MKYHSLFLHYAYYIINFLAYLEQFFFFLPHCGFIKYSLEQEPSETGN